MQRHEEANLSIRNARRYGKKQLCPDAALQLQLKGDPWRPHGGSPTRCHGTRHADCQPIRTTYNSSSKVGDEIDGQHPPFTLCLLSWLAGCSYAENLSGMINLQTDSVNLLYELATWMSLVGTEMTKSQCHRLGRGKRRGRRRRRPFPGPGRS